MPFSAPSFPLTKVLAMDTSTDRLSVALGTPIPDGPVWTHEGPGGAQASATLLPVVRHLLAQAGWSLRELDAIAFGCGPGSFTGLRTACAVVQGLAVAARPEGLPVLPIPTLWAVAEQAQQQWRAQGTEVPDRGLVVLDARMDEMYVAEFERQTDGACRMVGAPWLSRPEALGWRDPVARGDAPGWLAGNAMPVYGERLPAQWQRAPALTVWPSATALLHLSPRVWAQGGAVVAAEAQPLYVRDKVAQTTEERERLKATPRLQEQP